MIRLGLCVFSCMDWLTEVMLLCQIQSQLARSRLMSNFWFTASSGIWSGHYIRSKLLHSLLSHFMTITMYFPMIDAATFQSSLPV